jgi:hypothetical protein
MSTSARTVLIVAFSLVCAVGAHAQSVTFDLDEVSVPSGDTAAVDLRVEDFENVTSAQFTVTWDSTTASFGSVGNFNLRGLTGGNFGTPEDVEISDGTLTVVWSDPEAQGVTIGDSTSVFTLELAAAGAGGSQTALTFGDDPTAREVTADFEPVTFDGNDGAVLIGEGNQPPTASDDSFATVEGQALTVSAPGVLGNDTDPDGDSLAASVLASPSNGTLVLDGDGSFEYTPDSSFFGADTFTYTVEDTGGNESAEAAVTIEVNGRPVASSDSAQTIEQSAVTTAVLSNDTDPDGDGLDPATVAVQSGPENGTATANSDGTITYEPDGATH